MNNLKKGDVCMYSYDNDNKSAAIVEIIDILNSERGIAKVKFLEVLVDDTGNGFFNYLKRTGGTMNVSLKYLKVIKSEKGSAE
ncbi:MAG: hypothetical protein IJ031_05905 [Oscillospiraceae bacterium]|nr:hypothetical protein [Oscillospiraceae bacterium]MBQ8377585.1 hypothetical protein [Oscillospiraceae bacterium]MBQ8884108.1 hypothetical protein [Oscillospiraceae bacterium]